MMIFLEMSRVDAHGGGAWAFPNCIWSPPRKANGSKWAFWEKVLSTKDGDIVVHLRGIQPNAFFVGFSSVIGNGFMTRKRPPEPGEWSFSPSFYRADLIDYVPFHKPVSLTQIFAEKKLELESYFEENKIKNNKKNIFYVRQSGRLQCLNGAYLSELDDELFSLLFGRHDSESSVKEERDVVSVETGEQLKSIRVRLGQDRFSRKIKDLYRNKCCFPSCDIDDPRFLVGSHIARWSDNESMRGNLGNGLCLCSFHDKAFELGIFTIDMNYRIHINPKEIESAVVKRLIDFRGIRINLAGIDPLVDALQEHWERCDLRP